MIGIREKKKNVRSGELNRALTVLSIPTLLWYAAFCYLPVFGIIIAFKRYRLIPGKGFIYSLFKGSAWVGFDNFRFLLLNPQMSRVVRNTLLYNLAFILLGTLISVTLAVCLALIHSQRVRTVVQITFLLPYFMSWVIISYSVYAFLSADHGMVNSVITALNGTGISFYQKAEFWPFILVLVYIWKTSGYTMLIYFARLMSLDTQMFDSAAVDGASVGQMIRHIILPELKSVIIIMILLNLGSILSTDFGLFYQVTRNAGSIISTTETVDVFVYKALMEQSNFGFSAAAGLAQNGIGCLLLILVNCIIRRIDEEQGII